MLKVPGGEVAKQMLNTTFTIKIFKHHFDTFEFDAKLILRI